ncbi:MAG: DUF2911 domain-containing protein [Ferruginibacter sp.]
MRNYCSAFYIILVCFSFAGCNPVNPGKQQVKVDSIPGQEKNPYAGIDQSPMDMSYYPADYPLQKMSLKDSAHQPFVRLIYSRPHKKGRDVFGDGEKNLCRYGKAWRLGANEATEILFFTDVRIGGTKVNKGMYVMYCIPFEKNWIIVFNSNLHTWGLQMDTTKDVFKTNIPVETLSPALEDFTMVFTPAPGGTNLIMAWDNVKTSLPISFIQ